MKHVAIRVRTLIAACLLAAAASVPAVAFPAIESGTSVRAVKGFDRVELTTLGELVLTQGETESLEMEASSTDLARIATEVRGTTLRIGQVEPGQSPRGPVTYRLVVRTIVGLATTSSGSIRAEEVAADGLRVALSSSGSIVIDRLTAKTLDVVISSSGSFTVAGAVERQIARLSSSGEYRAADLESREASVSLSSSGSATVRVSERLDASMSSSGSVRYHGNPPRVASNASSSGRLVKLD